MTPSDPWLVEFLRAMSRRPGAYLGSERVEALSLYLHAYTFARTDLGLPAFGVGEEDILPKFEIWLEGHSGMHSTLGWKGLIERIDSSDQNIRTFIRLFDQFLREEIRLAEGLNLSSRP
jgi:hypothetical protein